MQRINHFIVKEISPSLGCWCRALETKALGTLTQAITYQCLVLIFNPNIKNNPKILSMSMTWSHNSARTETLISVIFKCCCGLISSKIPALRIDFKPVSGFHQQKVIKEGSLFPVTLGVCMDIPKRLGSPQFRPVGFLMQSISTQSIRPNMDLSRSSKLLFLLTFNKVYFYI